MPIYEVRDLHPWHYPYRWSVHKDGMPMNLYATEVEAYAHREGLINSPELYCSVCCAKLPDNQTCTNKGCVK